MGFQYFANSPHSVSTYILHSVWTFLESGLYVQNKCISHLLKYMELYKTACYSFQEVLHSCNLRCFSNPRMQKLNLCFWGRCSCLSVLKEFISKAMSTQITVDSLRKYFLPSIAQYPRHSKALTSEGTWWVYGGQKIQRLLHVPLFCSSVNMSQMTWQVWILRNVQVNQRCISVWELIVMYGQLIGFQNLPIIQCHNSGRDLVW